VEVVASPLGDYSVTVAPGFLLDVDKPADLDLAINFGTTPCASTHCQIPVASEAHTYSFSSSKECTSADRLLPQTRTTMATLQFAGANSTTDQTTGIVSCDPAETVTLTASSK
jgi:hypothetical protein